METQSDLQRDSLLAAADRRGMGIVLPGTAALAKSNITGAELRTAPFAALAPVAAEQGGEVVLVGRLVWDDRELGWATQWQMDWRGRTHRWQIRGVTFDEAFRRGIGGAAQILSGNGDPAAACSDQHSEIGKRRQSSSYPMPPSTWKHWRVMRWLSSDARNSARLAMSSGVTASGMA